MTLLKGMRSNDRHLESVTITYRGVNAPLLTSRVGYGETVRDAIKDADRQLSDGIWTREVVSTRRSVEADVKGNIKPQNLRARWIPGERETIMVEKRISTVMPNE